MGMGAGLSSHTFVSCTCEVWDTPLLVLVSGWAGAVIWMMGRGAVTMKMAFFSSC